MSFDLILQVNANWVIHFMSSDSIFTVKFKETILICNVIFCFYPLLCVIEINKSRSDQEFNKLTVSTTESDFW